MADHGAGGGFGPGVALEQDRREWGRLAADAPERTALLALGTALGQELRPRRLRMHDGSRLEVDGTTADVSTVVQLPLRAGEFTSQLRNKVMADLFKLTWLRLEAAPRARAILVIATPSAVAFRAGTWLARAAAAVHVEVWVWDRTAETIEPLAETSTADA